MRTGHSIFAGVLTLVTLGLAATPAAAQHAQTRQGFWAGVGMGWGSMGLLVVSGLDMSVEDYQQLV